MWRGHEGCLAVYGMTMCAEWLDRGYRDNLVEEFDRVSSERSSEPPYWLGVEELHASHRSSLLRKFPEHYGSLGWTEPSDLEYVWPTHRREK